MLTQFTPDDRTFALAFIAGHVGLMAVRIGFRVAAKDIVRPVVNRAEGIGNLVARWVLGALLVAAIVAYFVVPGAWMFVPVPSALRWVAIAGSVLSIALLVRAHRALNDEFSSTLRLAEGHRLVTAGPYRFVQHPIYLAFFVHFICTGIYTRSWPIGLLGVLTIGTLMTTRLRREEAMLRRAFGAEYEAYQASTGRFIPRLAPGCEPGPTPSRSRAPDRGRR